ncbi:DsbE family thiol:disulfide interchange protein [Saccharophagus sp. K07]|jgi:cytochrome c biogenesis protein CcmG/thiol:disulfide interchange protein DsbE|uniref:DsbE family thiol:disulfide interchange protein n=1 Tax=Saccharophagus sp. K07 TaxID=2283636 RepID=UPI001651BDF1|nr:DsbE family thiol:disulfide interchange protein [Saccharophagus sp. K07]MBC6906758.1 DsbE family thiol:disulfide interchange protein [Saccharophagus sp. K07]
MKRFKLFIPFAVFAVMAGLLYIGLSLDPNELPSVLIDKPVPEFALPDLDNPEKVITPATMKGKPYLLNVWATWCPSCKYEHPYLLKLAEMGIPIYGVNYKDESEKARKLLRDTGNPYQANIVDEEGTLIMALGVYGAPETFIVDAEGIIRYKLVGVVTEEIWTSTMAPIFFGE